MTLKEKFLFQVSSKQLFGANDTLIAAVSGGLDSMAMCELLKICGFSFIIAHCNFRLRNAESERDADFVEQYSAVEGRSFVKKDFETTEYATERGISIQLAARELRYQWFEELRLQNKKPGTATYILTAHHANDNAETVLMNFFRGTGIQGLRGILPKQNYLVRPLLAITREELEKFALAANLKWVEDSSNETDKYTRNFFRNRLLPEIRQIFPRVNENIADNINRFGEVEEIYRSWILEKKSYMLEYRNNEVHIPILKLLKARPLQSILYEIISDYGFSAIQASEVEKIMSAETGKYVASASHRIIKNRNWLIIAPRDSSDVTHQIIEEFDSIVRFSDKVLRIESLSSMVDPPDKRAEAFLDSGELTYPLIVRNWKQGDYFYPLGMTKKKKIARFLIDQKISRSDKEKILVILSGDRVVWVVGHRIDNRFRITDSTTRILKLSIE